jgi:hypothetical protein
MLCDPISDSMCTSPAVLLDPENMGTGVGISLLYVYELRYTLFHVLFWLQTAILIYHLLSLAVLMDPENMGIGVGILLLSGIQAEIRVLTFGEPPSWISHFCLLTYLLLSSV